jgi:hypothetical protein
MPINTETLNKKLFNLLKSQGYNPIPKDSKDDAVPVPDEADVFQFSFPISDEQVEKVYATIDTANNLIVYYDDDVFSSEIEDSQDWYKLLRHLKYWALNNQLTFDLINKDHLSNDMAQREYMKNKEKLDEGYYPMGKSASYNNDIPSVKIILQHTRQIQEGEQRFRNIAKIFLENTEGERILAPTTRPGLARIYARHLAEGGVPNDERWNHIKGLCEEYSKMAGFVRATKNKTFNESATPLIQEGLNHYNNLRETLGKLTGHRGYNMYFESWTPTLMEDDSEESTVNELFVQETLDPRIESVMPILKKLQKKINEMSEVNQLEAWADSVISESFKEEENTTESKESHPELQAIVDQYEKYEGPGSFHQRTHEYSDDHSVYQRGSDLHRKYNELKQKLEQNLDETKKKSTEEKLKDALKKGGYDMDKGSRRIDDIINRLKELEKEYNKDKVSEAPGAETLAHDDETEEHNLKAFGLAEDDLNELDKSTLASYAKKARQDAMINRSIAGGFDSNAARSRKPGLKQAATDLAKDYRQKARKREDNIDKAIDRLAGLSESTEYNDVTNSIINRILNTKPELLSRYGVEYVMNAIEDVAQYVGDVEEIGSSDVSGWVRQVIDQLSARDMSEGKEFGAYYHEQLAQDLHDKNPDLDDDMDILTQAFIISKADPKIGSRAKNIFNQEDFPNDLVSAYHACKQGVAEGYTVTRGIDKERYQSRPGLEGPFSAKNGKVVYYDKVEGKYYDPDTDMYIDYEDWQAMNEEGVSEDLDANQKRVGQLGPTEKVRNNNIGKLVGTSESVDTGEYDARKKQPSSKEENDKVFAKHRERMKNLDKDDKKEVKEGQEDLNAILRIIRK